MSKFVVVSTARSGSTVVCTSLDRQANIACHGELFGQRKILRVSGKYTSQLSLEPWSVARRDADARHFVDAYMQDLPGQAVGFKVLLSQLDADYVHYPSVKRAIPYGVKALLAAVAAQDAKILFLWRRDLVGRFDSELNFRLNRGLPHDTFDRVTRNQCIADFKMQQDSARRVMRLLKAAGCQKPRRVDYEDIVSDPAVMTDIYAWLGVLDDGTRLPPKKVNTGPAAPSVSGLLSASELARYRNVKCPR
ncbi:sulfotransferase [Maricaulis sp.]|uniref:sulfotransferase n=1 Tax=Maricaulis sp. TaxID=1486257 RepID=UPI003A909FA4